MPIDLNLYQIEKQLCLQNFERPDVMTWLEESYLDPKAFWHDLQRAQAEYFPFMCKSTPFGQYDFYYDVVIRNSDSNYPAFCWYDSIMGWQEIRYIELADLVNLKASNWVESGVESGQKICLIQPMGVQFAISLIAALKIGLTVSILPPSGSRFIQNRLESLAPDHIETDTIYHTLIPTWEDRILNPVESSSNLIPNTKQSHSYASGEVVAMLFDPTSQTPHIPVELGVDAAYLCPLRDGLVAMNLRPGQVLAAPGFHILETQPGLLFAAWLNGATYLHIDPVDIENTPELLLEYPIKMMGVCNKVRDIVLDNKLEIGTNWACWFRNPADSIDISTWQSFIEVAKLEEAFAGNMKWEAARGGCSLFSIKRKGRANVNVLPSAGIPYHIADLSEPGIVSLSDYGLLSVSPVGTDDGEEDATINMIARSRAEFTYLSSRVSGRGGMFFPRDEVLTAIGEVCDDFCYSLFGAPVYGMMNDPLFILLIFTGGEKIADESLKIKQIRRLIERKMGEEFLPDRIQFFPLYPRCCEDGYVDHNWCRDQYLTGGLFRKSKDEISICVSTLRRRILRK